MDRFLIKKRKISEQQEVTAETPSKLIKLDNNENNNVKNKAVQEQEIEIAQTSTASSSSTTSSIASSSPSAPASSSASVADVVAKTTSIKNKKAQKVILDDPDEHENEGDEKSEDKLAIEDHRKSESDDDEEDDEEDEVEDEIEEEHEPDQHGNDTTKRKSKKSKQHGKLVSAKRTTNSALMFKSGKYDPEKAAIWEKGQKTPYLFLAQAFDQICQVTSRLKIIELLTNCFRAILTLSPDDLLPSIYLCINCVAPAHEGLELGIGDSTLIKAIAEATGKTTKIVKESYSQSGDLGIVAKNSRNTQRTLFVPPKLTIQGVYESFRYFATETGKDSLQKKKDKIKLLLVACRESEAQYIVRSLQGKMRIGLAEQTVLVALAYAFLFTRQSNGEDLIRKLTPEKLQDRMDAAESALKQAYSEVPSYDHVIPVLLKNIPFEELHKYCHLTPGVPVKPMLAKPSKGVTEVMVRFENKKITCEWKYDGERAQVHVISKDDVRIFSRNAENHTGKYPDLIEMLPRVMKDNVKNCVLDCEVVAFNVQENKILPFQVLSTRGRKNIQISDIKVRVCLFAFDLLYLNDESLLRSPLSVRRQRMFDSFNTLDSQFQFARHLDSNDPDEIQSFFQEATEGNCEGLMVKALEDNATYEPSKRTYNWLKIKKDYVQSLTDSLDLVPIGAYIGKGKRTGVYGGYLLACYNPDEEKFQSICKIGTGFSEDALSSQFAFFKEHIIPAPKNYYSFGAAVMPDVWFEDCVVWEIRAADLSISPVHTAAAGMADPSKGIALRFPRFIRVREDKKPDMATTAEDVVHMYLNQASIRSKTPTTSVQGEDESEEY